MNDPADPEDDAATEAFSASGEPLTRGPARPTNPPTGASAAPRSEPFALRHEHYTVLTREDGSAWELGRGAMGVTYKAVDERLHCHVALKVIKADLLAGDPVARERFLREARAAARLRHPNIASVFHLGETAAGQAFYAMEFIAGETLQARIRRRGPLPVPFALEITTEVVRALVAARQQGLVHRDLKPANLMLVANSEGSADDPGSGSEAGEARVKVIDFGLAKAASDTGPLTGAGDFLGTPQYASPEQFTDNDHETDTRSDIYSLGVTLWYALTGNLPFPGKSLAEVRARQLSEALPLGQLDAARVPAPVATLLASMLAPDPADRPQTPHLLLEALRRCRARIEPHPNPGTTAAAAVRKRRSRARPGAAVFVAAGLALLVFMGAGAWLLRSRFAAPAPDAPGKSVAVLPFANLSDDKENAFFADGVQDEILTDLAKVADLKVISAAPASCSTRAAARRATCVKSPRNSGSPTFSRAACSVPATRCAWPPS